MPNNEGAIANLSFEFSISVVNCYKQLVFYKKEYILSKQLLKSGTSIGAMVREAQNAESRADFIHKLGVAQKECAESQYWLDLLKATNYMSRESHQRLYSKSGSLLKMIRSAIITTKRKRA